MRGETKTRVRPDRAVRVVHFFLRVYDLDLWRRLVCEHVHGVVVRGVDVLIRRGHSDVDAVALDRSDTEIGRRFLLGSVAPGYILQVTEGVAVGTSRASEGRSLRFAGAWATTRRSRRPEVQPDAQSTGPRARAQDTIKQRRTP